MDLMDIAKNAAGKILGSNTQSTDMVGAISQLINENGGIGNIVEKFNSAGLGEIIQSWISQGQNSPINLQQLTQVFGNDQIEKIATSLGLSSSDLGNTLTTALPQLVDKLTPSGQLSAESLDMGKIIEIGKSFLAKN